MKKRYRQWLSFIIILLIMAIVSILISLISGDLKISIKDIPGILNTKSGLPYTILYKIRLPRIVLGFAIGGSLSLAGVILQGIYRNPLVEPYTLGISGGAAVGVAIAIVFAMHLQFGTFLLPLFGFVGALITIFLVYLFSVRKGEINIKNMLLIGVMISFIASSVMMFILATTTSDTAYNIIFWTMGSLEEPNTSLIKLTTIIAICGLILSYFFARPLNALRLGQTKAKHLGINTEMTIRMLFVISSVLTGVSVSVAGVIGFVGLVIPHLIRSIIGSDFRILLIGSFLGGGIFLVLSDVLAHTLISPNELPVGVITGIIGGSAFIFVLTRSKFKTVLK